MSIFTNKRTLVLYLLMVLPALFSGCMQQTSRGSSRKATFPVGSGGSDSGWSGGGWYQDPYAGGTGDTGSYNPNTGNETTITANFSLTGVGGTKTFYNTGSDGIYIVTDNLLQVRVRAGQAGPLTLNEGSTPFTANYGCVSYLVTVGGKSVRTKPLLANGQASAYCPDGVAEQTIDFSDRLSSGGANLSVNVSEPRYDFYCQLWYACQTFPNSTTYSCYYSFPYSYYNSYCPTRAVYKSHTVTGDLDILTN